MIPVKELEDMKEYTERKYGKGEIDRAGECLVEWWKTPNATLMEEPFSTAYGIVENWRTSHGFPLVVFQRVLRKRARELDGTAIVAKRLKRFTSAIYKLLREEHMKLSQMQDLGGCRAIVRDVPTVYKLCENYLKIDSNSPPPWTAKCYDYIKCPKADGYRGIHVVGRYRARQKKFEPWDGHRIEIQLRSKLQHAFATAVETVTTFTRQPLKFGGGLVEWKRFFSLMGTVLALREGTTLVEGTPQDKNSLIGELRVVVKELNVRKRLRGWTRALKQLRRRNIRDYKWLLIVLNTSDNTIEVTGFKVADEASKAVADIEKTKGEDVDAVLVWVSSITELKEAYPNYYADTREFIKALNVATRSQGRLGLSAST